MLSLLNHARFTCMNFVSFVCLAAVMLAGCVATTTDIDRLQDSMNTMQKSQADLIVQMDELDRSLVALSEKLGENQKKMGTLTQKLDDTQLRLGGRMENISQLLSAATTHASVPVPGELYRTAYGDYQSGKIDLAISGFKSFMERYPTSDLVDSAQFYIADCYLIKKDFAQARVEFDKVLSTSIEFRPQALLKRSYCLAELNQRSAQKDTLQALIKEFPGSPEAQTAKQIIKELESELAKEKAKSAPKKKSP